MGSFGPLVIAVLAVFGIGGLAYAGRRESTPSWLSDAEADSQDGGSFICAVVGESFKNDDGSSRQAIIKKLRAGDALDLVLEPGNPKDPQAMAVISERGQIGYLKRAVARRMARDLEQGAIAEAKIHRIGSGPNTKNRGVFLSVRVVFPDN